MIKMSLEEKYKDEIEKIKKKVKDSITGFDGEVEITLGPYRSSDISFKLSDDLKKIELDFYSINFPQSFDHYYFELIQDIVFKMNKIREKQYYEEKIKDLESKLENFSLTDNKQRILDFIKQGEGPNLEFKSSLCWDIERNILNRQLEFEVLKTVAGFLNALGGILLIGVDDDGKILGLTKDYKSLGKKKSSDEFQIRLNQIINQCIGKEFSNFWRTKFLNVNDREICAVEVDTTKEFKPAFVNYKGREYFFIRKESETLSLKPSEIYDYTRDYFTNHEKKLKE